MGKVETKRVLIVEDDQYIREMYALVLRNAGFEVVEAEDGIVGLNEAEKGGFGAILLDLMMPKKDGLSFLRSLKDKKPKKENGPIIVMSNLAYSDARVEAMELGATDFFVKADLEPKQVVEAVQKVLKK